MTNSDTYEFLIVGSGLAGLFAAYHASKYGTVLVVTKINEKKSNSWLAQGGIAAAMGEDSVCEYMKMITLEKLLKTLRYDQYEVKVPVDLAEKARLPINRMLEIN